MLIFKHQNDLLKLFLIIAGLLFSSIIYSQGKFDSILNKVDPQKWAAVVEKKAAKLEEKIIEKSLKTLYKLQKQEEKIYRKLLDTKDSLQAKVQLEDLKLKYTALKNKFTDPLSVYVVKQYIPELDSTNTALKFLQQSELGGKVKGALANSTSLQNRFQGAEEIKQFIRQRREQLKSQLEKLGLVQNFKKFNKEVYYYAAQIKEYKEILKDPKKIEKKAIEMLSKTKLFQDFMRKNSMLASLFRMPSDVNEPTFQGSLAGLQTRTQVNSLIQQQIATGGPNARQQFQQNIQSAQSQLNQLKDNAIKFGIGSSEDVIPEGFNPNSEKTKSFFKRLEVGTNVQTQSARSYFPVTSDLGLSVGYKLNSKSILGIGVSYKLGWGTGWDNIRISNEGVGFRSFIDWKIKGAFWISGGFEMNYKTAFNRISQLKDLTAWQRSGLLGISKSIPIKSKILKKTKVQLLWDFLSYNQVPKTQPIVFRIGYNIK